MSVAAEVLGDSVFAETYQALLAGPVQEGSQGDAVKGVQQLLAAFGEDVKVDGDAGAKTIKALKAVEKSPGMKKTKSLDASGFVKLLLAYVAYTDPDAAQKLQEQYGIYGSEEDCQKIIQAAAARKGE